MELCNYYSNDLIIAVNVSFYPSAEALSSVAWIPGQHYSGPYGHLKLTLPYILPKSLSDVILLDTDLTFAANIEELWKLFKSMSDVQVGQYIGANLEKKKIIPALRLSIFQYVRFL